MIFSKSLIALALCAAPVFGKKKTNLRKKRSLSVKVDGKIDEWNLDSDFVHDMYNTEDKVAAKAYAKWDCATSTVCVLVLGEAGNTIDNDEAAWVKDYQLNGKLGSHLMRPDHGFSWIQADCGNTVGWEGCYSYKTAGLHDQMEIHTNFNDGNTASTGYKANGDFISLELACADDATTGCGADGVCAIKDTSVEQKRRKLQDDPCILYPNKNNHNWKGWKGSKALKPGCGDEVDDGSEEEEPESQCKCDQTYAELQATGLCNGKQIPICHTGQGNSHETICVAISGWENGHCKQHDADFCGGCPGDDSGNGENAKKNKN